MDKQCKDLMEFDSNEEKKRFEVAIKKKCGT